MKVDLQAYNDHIINVRVSQVVDEKIWRFTRFYGHPNMPERHLSWHLLKNLQHVDDMEWLIGGNFNKILSTNEKIGGPPCANWQMEAFKEAINLCGLHDLQFSSHAFTWSNGD